MSISRLATVVPIVLFGTASTGEVPSVVVDIAPVHALVAQVMAGVGDPRLIVPPAASPHDYALRPSDAQALQTADVVFWMGKDLSPRLQSSIIALAEEAEVIEVLALPETTLLELREGATFETHDHDDHSDQEEHHDHDDHEGRYYDSHAWLSPENSASWLDVIAAELSAVDPENAEAYAQNAEAGKAEIVATVDIVNTTLAPVRGRPFIVFHDAYQYFEAAFGLSASGALSLGDATDPSPARIAEIQARVRDEGIACVLSEPQFSAGLVAAVLDGTEAKTGVLDPLGASLDPGAAFYKQLLLDMATVLADCLE